MIQIRSIGIGTEKEHGEFTRLQVGLLGRFQGISFYIKIIMFDA